MHYICVQTYNLLGSCQIIIRSISKGNFVRGMLIRLLPYFFSSILHLSWTCTKADNISASLKSKCIFMRSSRATWRRQNVMVPEIELEICGVAWLLSLVAWIC